MEQSPSWEANRFVDSQEIPHILLNTKVYYCIHNCPSPVSILSQPNPVDTPTSHFLKIHPNILPSMPRSSHWCLSLSFPHQNPIHASPPTHATYPAHLVLFYLSPTQSWVRRRDLKLCFINILSYFF
jgi:hypothetical protein